ncbi:MAG: methyltransferase type 11 [Parcubacteria group bacterium Greene0416_39]|nr:MAG: methyltransferase type 11 [Parcubacteria group bacterium Greene0416_39]
MLRGKLFYIFNAILGWELYLGRWAKQLSQEVGVSAHFICSDIYNLPDVLDKKFDIIFTSYGVLAWLPDLKKWAEVIHHFLKDGGVFYIAEIHPLTTILSKDFKITEPYFTKEPFIEESGPDYADNTVIIESKAYMWTHTLSDIINVLLGEGLKIEFLHEFPFTVYEQFPGFMEEDEKGIYRFKDKNIQIPLLFSLKAFK